MLRQVTSTITSKGQTTIPKEIRYMLGLEEGNKIVYTPCKEGFIISRATDKNNICPYCKGTGRCKKNKESDSS
ncbi:AbrB/MazE/SpoVT family DNA-binding domain-containing protein [Desulfofalx alkaliphila]|uniref:AbrB/MazE/SpoVT family DNA-binding domain-containing protein n=1 Tax=Desulfofalx alkaliphila TaxID=105483 RepID=UPI0004E1DE19|nr:type II toxin-antitoxin system PrlF family antitoxin [Desulfofalx alkaliphila]